MILSLFTRQISDLNGENILNDISLNQAKRFTDILIIDDDTFTYLDFFKKHQYNVTHKTDIETLKDVEGFDIILCDIRGVGKFLGSGYEGAYLVKQIKETYPNKIVISYTADAYEPNFQEYIDYADNVMPKGSALEDWTSLLDDLIKECKDPVKQWENTREALFKAGVPTIKVAQIESKYVKAIKEKDFDSLKKLYNKKNTKEAEIILSLAKSVMFKLLEGNIG